METYIETTTEIEVSGLTFPGIKPSLAVIARKELALKKSAGIVMVENAQDQEKAVEAMKALKSIQKGVESSRELVKRPAIEIGRAIDSCAKDFVSEVNSELNRLSDIVSAFQKLEMKRIQELREREQAKQQALLDEERKKLAELQAKVDAAKTAAGKLKALQAMDKVEQQTHEKVITSIQTENKASVERVAGMRFQPKWNFEVTDINALAASKPHAITIEPNNMVIRGLISGGMRECPGLRIFEDFKTNVRA